MSNSLDPDQARQDVGPDLNQNYLQRLSADDTSMENVYMNTGGRSKVLSLTHRKNQYCFIKIVSFANKADESDLMEKVKRHFIMIFCQKLCTNISLRVFICPHKRTNNQS